MLLGEHAVMYGKPCIVTAVNQRMSATIEFLDEPVFQLEAPDVNISNYKKPLAQVGIGDIPKGARFVEVALKNFSFARRGLAKLKKGGIRVVTKSEFSSQFGFGSSSASTACVVKGLSEIFDLKLSQKEIFDIAYQTVLDVQGKGSGFDVAAAIYGGTLYFVAGGKVIEPLNIKSLFLVVGYSGIKADTVTLLNKVAQKAKKDPEGVENIYNSIEELVEDAKITLVEGDWKKLGKLMNRNQDNLQVLEVSIPKLDAMIAAARENGAYGAKLSGAGGGDCMIALCSEENRKRVSEAIEKADGKILNVLVNAEGVRIES